MEATLDKMKLRALRDGDRIEQAQRVLEGRIRSSADESGALTLGFQGGALETTVHWLSEQGIWIGVSDLKNRFWIALGIGNPFIDSHPIVAEINSPKSGIDRRIAGLFLADHANRVYLAHRGRVGGGRKGIGKKAFLAWYPEPCESFIDGSQPGEAIVIGSLDEPGLIDNLAVFGHRVARFKEQVVSPQR